MRREEAESPPVDAAPNSVQERDKNNSSRARTYRVKDIFRTVQGEGFWSGRPAVFVRLVGCNMWSGYEEDRKRDAERTGAHCPLWCDEDFTKEGAVDYSADQLTTRMRDVGGDINFCVLTGGEPFLQADATLIQALHEAEYKVAIETNGTIPIRDAFWSEKEDQVIAPDWITCSPKLPEERLELEHFDELKLIVPDYRPSDYSNFSDRGVRHNLAGEKRRVLQVQPEDGPRLRRAKEVAVEIATENPSWWVSTQSHKMLEIE